MSEIENKFEHFINEIIRINYKCNWKCNFCNVWLVNNYWDKDINHKEVIYKILTLGKKYSLKEKSNLVLSFSWWEPTLNKNLFNYIKLAKNIWIWRIQIQTNWSLLYLNHSLYDKLFSAWLNEIFLAQHSENLETNMEMWCYYDFNDFLSWFNYVRNSRKNIKIYLNIVITKINIEFLYKFIIKLIDIWFIKHIWNKISFWFCQPNWYAWDNKEDTLLVFDDYQINLINKVINYCKSRDIYLDFHYTSPPICILQNPEYNLEYKKLKILKNNKNISTFNLNSFKFLWKEKSKLSICKTCRYDNYCLWFYKNWIKYIWKDILIQRVKDFLSKY